MKFNDKEIAKFKRSRADVKIIPDKVIFTFTDIPKVSLNKFYEGGHWGKRQKAKESIVKALAFQIRYRFPLAKYKTTWLFTFKTKPLDASNAIGGMGKIIEDFLFEKDDWNLIRHGGVESVKGLRNTVRLLVEDDHERFGESSLFD